MRASLAATYPGLPPLRAILTGTTGITADDLGDYVAHLPAGCALWRDQGGTIAWSDETHMLALVLNGLDVLAWQNTAIMTRNPRGKAPQPIQPPKGAAEAAEAAERLESKREKRAARAVTRKRLRATE